MTKEETPRGPITFFRCDPGEPIPPQPTQKEEEADKDREHAYQQYLADAAAACRCGPLWGICEGVLAGGLCDELHDERDELDAEDLDPDDEEAWGWG